MRNGKIIAATMEKVGHYDGINTPADGKKYAVFSRKQLFFLNKFLKILFHQQIVSLISSLFSVCIMAAAFSRHSLYSCSASDPAVMALPTINDRYLVSAL